jgi:hypothetical protein
MFVTAFVKIVEKKGSQKIGVYSVFNVQGLQLTGLFLLKQIKTRT